MRTLSLLAIALLVLATFAHAAPSEINYQGVLTDQNGNPVNGVRAMQIKIYDAPTGGTLLYSEDLGNVPVQDGIYSFSFGANGTSNALTTETVAIANGTISTFQKVLSAPTIVAGSVTITDGTYTWDQTNGSSNENDFSVAYSPNLRRVTVTYYNGAPAAGKTITAKFRAPGSGIIGALAEDNQPWIEVSLAGVAQTPRQKVLTVPFAAFARSVNVESIANEVKTIAINIQRVTSQYDNNSGSPISFPYNARNYNSTFPIFNSWGASRGIGNSAQWEIPQYIKSIKTITLKYVGSVSVSIPGSNWSGGAYQASSETTTVIPVNLTIPFVETYCIILQTGAGAKINEMSILADVSPIVNIND